MVRAIPAVKPKTMDKDKLNDCAQTEYTKRGHEYESGHEGGHSKPFETEIGYNIIDNHNERTGRAALSAPSIAGCRHDETALLWR